jgi:tRNA(His) 5'-end guanylyltransferase
MGAIFMCGAYMAKKGIEKIATEMVKREKFSGLRVKPPFVVRVDIRNAGAICKKHFQKGGRLSQDFHKILVGVGRNVIETAEPWVGSCYVQSDELSFVCLDKEPPYGGRVEKINSILAAEASSLLTSALLKKGIGIRYLAFDSRIIPLKNIRQVGEYLAWRRADCVRNTVNWYSEKIAGHKKVVNMKQRQRAEMIKKAGIEIPEEIRFGTLLHKIKTSVDAVNRKTGEKVTITRSRTTTRTGNALESVF